MRGVGSARLWLILILIVIAVGLFVFLSMPAEMTLHAVDIPTLQLE
jgi:hypothetical protein